MLDLEVRKTGIGSSASYCHERVPSAFGREAFSAPLLTTSYAPGNVARTDHIAPSRGWSPRRD